MGKINQDKANDLSKFLEDLFKSCGGECKNCALENICDDLDIINFHIQTSE